MDLETTLTNAVAKLPLLKQGEYEMWRLRIEKGLKGQKEAKTVKNRQGTKETRKRVKKQPKIKAGSARHSKKG
ncbi:hypothetical protein Tco_1398744, partial [Tanacetum coccineum]